MAEKMNKYNLNRYNLSQWEIDVLNEFNTEDCLVDLMDMVGVDDLEEFLSTLADSLVSFKELKK